MLLISIPTPCHEKWNEMSPNEQGAFCGVCSKTVVDFTSLSDAEVQNYFLNQRGQKTCGRFRNDQLKDNDDSLKRLLAGSIPFWKKFLAIVLVVFGSLLTGCQNNTSGDIVVKETKEYTTKEVTLGGIDQEISDTLVVQCTPGESSMGMVESIPVKVHEDVVGTVIETPIEVVGEVIYMPKDENGNIKKEQEERE